jgi:[ribosomal protein S18]-alanine N-acetyltransferase
MASRATRKNRRSPAQGRRLRPPARVTDAPAGRVSSAAEWPSPRVSPRLRRAAAHDVPALVALESRSFATDRLSPRQFRHHLGRGHSWLAVAAVGDRLLGDVLLFFRRGSRVARLYSIVVDAAARGLGVGAGLLRAAEREARRRGCEALVLEVRTGNRGAIALYERFGYARVERRRGYYEDGADAWRYRKVLARSAGRVGPTAAPSPRRR